MEISNAFVESKKVNISQILVQSGTKISQISAQFEKESKNFPSVIPDDIHTTSNPLLIDFQNYANTIYNGLQVTCTQAKDYLSKGKSLAQLLPGLDKEIQIVSESVGKSKKICENLENVVAKITDSHALFASLVEKLVVSRQDLLKNAEIFEQVQELVPFLELVLEEVKL